MTVERMRDLYTEAVRLRAQGKTYVEIGEAMGVSDKRARDLVNGALTRELDRLHRMEVAMIRGGTPRHLAVALRIQALASKLLGRKVEDHYWFADVDMGEWKVVDLDGDQRPRRLVGSMEQRIAALASILDGEPVLIDLTGIGYGVALQAVRAGIAVRGFRPEVLS